MRQLKSFLEKKKGYCSEGRCSCLLLSARRDYEINGCNCEDGFYPMPTSITLSKTEVLFTPGDTETITATVLPEEAAKFYPVSWKSSDTTVATVEDGVITAVNWGTATITAKAGNVSATVAVSCDIPVQSITVSSDSVTLNPGGEEYITVSTTPEAASSVHPVSLVSNDETVATVAKSGTSWVITYVGEGETTVVATAGDKSATIAVTCVAPSFPYLCFTANVANSSVKVEEMPTVEPISLETSINGTTWTDYTVGDTITLASIGDKVYWRNKSETATNVWNYHFVMTGSLSASGDLGYFLCKNSTDTIANPLGKLFRNCESLTSAPELPATNLCVSAYEQLFDGCVNLETLPTLPATTLAPMCYSTMFQGCSKIKLSETQTGEYQTPYRIPIEGTGVDEYGVALSYMFAETGGTFTGTPLINTTYYTSNTVI